MLYLSHFSLQSELESVKEENDIVKVFSAVMLSFATTRINVICLNCQNHRHQYDSNLRQLASEHLHMRVCLQFIWGASKQAC